MPYSLKIIEIANEVNNLPPTSFYYPRLDVGRKFKSAKTHLMRRSSDTFR